jgi:hypothetical protein
MVRAERRPVKQFVVDNRNKLWMTSKLHQDHGVFRTTCTGHTQDGLVSYENRAARREGRTSRTEHGVLHRFYVLHAGYVRRSARAERGEQNGVCGSGVQGGVKGLGGGCMRSPRGVKCDGLVQPRSGRSIKPRVAGPRCGDATEVLTRFISATGARGLCDAPRLPQSPCRGGGPAMRGAFGAIRAGP